MNYNHLSVSIACPFATFEALRDALSIKAADFVNQDAVSVGSSFLGHFPPTRAGEPLSGLWDHFDPLHLGYSALEYRNPGVEVEWRGGNAVLAGNRVCIESTLSIIQHVCRAQLPVVIEWLSEDHRQRPQATISKAALITADAILTQSSAAIASRWRAECGVADNLSADIPAPGDGALIEASGYFDVFLAEELSLEQCTIRYASILDAALRCAAAGHVEQSGDSITNEFCDGEATICSEIVAFAEKPDRAIVIARGVLAAVGCRVGAQIQYERGGNLLFETYRAGGWSSPQVASVIVDGRAYESEVWKGGLPARPTMLQ